MSQTSYRHALKKLDLRCFRSQKVVELSDDDKDRRVEFCETWIQKFENETNLVDHIIWSDESQFRLDGVINTGNCTFWCNENPHVQIEIKNDKRGVQCGVE